MRHHPPIDGAKRYRLVVDFDAHPSEVDRRVAEVIEVIDADTRMGAVATSLWRIKERKAKQRLILRAEPAMRLGNLPDEEASDG